MENFQELFWASLRDGSYNDGLREKIKVLRDTRHIGVLRCIQDIKNGIESTIVETTIKPISVSNNGWTPDLKWEEMANTIMRCEHLSQSSDQPSYYPPVPAYTIPVGKTHSIGEISKIQRKKQLIKAENFVRENINIFGSLMPLAEFQKRHSNLQKLGIGSPMSFYTKAIDINTGQVNIPSYSYPEITTCVSSIVGVLTHPDTHTIELTSISVLQNPTPLKTLIEFLENMNVSNNDDRISAIIFLRELYWSITPKP